MIRLQYKFDLAQVIWLCVAIVLVKQFFLLCSINEQSSAIRFCFRLEHSVTETLAKLQQAKEIVFCQEPRFFGGLRHFQKKESRLKMNHEAEGLPSSSRTD